MNKHPGYFEEELHGFIDGELDPERAEAIAKLLETDPDAAARVAAYRADKQQLEALYRELESAPLPEAWLKQIQSHAPAPEKSEAQPVMSAPFARRGDAGRRMATRPSYFSRRNLAALAACLMIAAGSLIGYQQFSGGLSEEAIIAEAKAARSDTVHPQQTFAAAQLAEPERRDEVVAAALQMPLKVPDLKKFGYQLADMHVYSDVPGGKAVELEYRNPQHRLFTLYMRHPNAPARVDMMEKNGTWTCIWQDDVLGTVMQGEMSAGEMARLASLAYNELYL